MSSLILYDSRTQCEISGSPRCYRICFTMFNFLIDLQTYISNLLKSRTEAETKSIEFSG